MYTSTWKKYLPVIRLLLKKSAVADQKVSLNRTDFERNNRLRKPVCSFDVEVINGRLQKMNPAPQVKGLIDVLMEDSGSAQLLRQKHYSIVLSSDFQLTIKNLTPAEETVKTEQEEE